MLVLLLVFGVWHDATAGTLGDAPHVEHLVAGAAMVFSGVVEDEWCLADAESAVYTRHRVRVKELFRGSVSDDFLVL